MWKRAILMIFILSSIAFASEYNGTLSIGSVSSPPTGLAGSSYAYTDGSACIADSQCPSGNCAIDFDGSGRWCAPAGRCAHSSSSDCDSGCYSYTNSSTLCESSGIVQTCRSEEWVASSCSCSNNQCVSTASSDGGSSGSGNANLETYGINSTCIYNSECSSGYCVHSKCRTSSTYCGDGYCDSGENCAADSDACAADETCSDGCRKRLQTIGSLGTTQEIAKRSVSEIMSLIDNSFNLRKGIEFLLGKELTEELKNEISNHSERITANTKFQSSLVIDEETGQSMIILNITLSGTEKARNFMVYDTIPKRFAESSDDITVMSTAKNMTIIEKDPIYMLSFGTVYPNQPISVIYRVNDIVSSDVLDNAVEPVILAEYSEPVVCGDGICEPGEDCPQDCGENNLLLYALLYAVVVVIIIVMILIAVKKMPKSKKEKPMNFKKETAKKNVAKKENKTIIMPFSKKLEKIKKKKGKRFVYRYEA